MKKPSVNFFDKAISTYMKEGSFINEFTRYWGTFTYNGVEYFNPYNNYFSKNSYPWTSYTSVLSSSCDGVVVNGLSGKAPNCSREQKLFKFLGIWNQLSNQNTDGLESAWLFLNPVKNNVQDTILIDELNKYIVNNKDSEGRLKFKVKILTNNSWIPGIGITDTTINDQAINIVGYDQYTNVTETVSTGVESVRSYDTAKNYIKTNATTIWGNNGILAVQADNTATYESLLARYGLLFLNSSDVRIEYIQKGLIPYTIYNTFGSDGVVNNNYVTIQNNGVYTPFNSVASGKLYPVTYVIPSYDITFVVRNPPTITATDPLGTQLLADSKYAYVSTTNNYTSDSGIYTDVSYHIKGRVNGYMSYSAIMAYYNSLKGTTYETT
jgi:hypothetical protein